MRAFAEAVRRSAAATSGRRSRRSEGENDRDRGRRDADLRGRDREVGRGLPDEDRDRVLGLGARDAEVDRLRARRLEKRLGLRDVHAGDDALVVPVLREAQRPLLRGDVRLQKLFLRVDAVELEPVDGELGLHGEPDVLEVRAGGVGARDARLDAAPHAPPDVQLPGRVRGHAVERGRGRRGRRSARGGRRAGAGGRRPRPGHGRGPAHRRIEVRAGLPDGRACRPVAGFGLRDGLVRRRHLLLERVETRISEQFPPGSARKKIARLRELPLRGLDVRLLEGGRLRQGRLPVIRADRARRQKERERRGEKAPERIRKRAHETGPGPRRAGAGPSPSAGACGRGRDR